MAARIICSAIALLVAGCGFFDTTPAQPLDPVGVLFLTLAGLIWFGWEPIHETYAYHRDMRSEYGGRTAPMLYRLEPSLRFRPGGRDKAT
jgi:hypothetical protein